MENKIKLPTDMDSLGSQVGDAINKAGSNVSSGILLIKIMIAKGDIQIADDKAEFLNNTLLKMQEGMQKISVEATKVVGLD